jgi:putative ATP-binding cassette transporter
VPIVVASPRNFAGAITLGVLMQITQAFLEVTRSLNWFVDKFPCLPTGAAPHRARGRTGRHIRARGRAGSRPDHQARHWSPTREGREVARPSVTCKVGHAAATSVIRDAECRIQAGEKC